MNAGHAVLVGPDLHFAHGKIALHPVRSQAGGEFIQIRRLRRPGSEHGNRHGNFGVGPALVDRAVKLHRTGRVVLGFHGDFHGAFVKLRLNTQIFDVTLRHFLCPDRLPDAALGRIPYAAPLGFLLPPGQGTAVGVVPHPHQQNVVPGDFSRQIHRKSRVAACMAAQRLAVQVHRGDLIHRAEVQQQSSLFALQAQRPAVPQVLPRLQRPVHTGKRRLRGKGHQDAPIPLLRRLVGICDGIVPQTVEDAAALPPHLRPGVLLQHPVPVHRIAPKCFHGARLLFFYCSTAAAFMQGKNAAGGHHLVRLRHVFRMLPWRRLRRRQSSSDPP